MLKKIISVVLVISVMCSMVIFADAQNNKATPNKNLLESLLNSRSWVLDILVDGDYSTNPYITGVRDFDEYSEAAYKRFVDDGFNKTLVRLVDILYNASDYLSDGLRYLTSEQIEEIRGYYGILIPEDMLYDSEYLLEMIENTLHSVFGKTREEKYYDYLFNGIFTTNYKTESQMSLEEEEVKFSKLQTYVDGVDSLKEMMEAAKDWASSCSDAAEYAKATKVKDLFTGYSYSIGTYLDMSAAPEILETVEIADDVRDKKLSFTDTVYNLTMYQRSCGSDEDIEAWRKEIQADKFIKKTNKVLSGIGQAVSFANSALENYVLIESLQHQKDTTLGPLHTLYDNTSNQRLKKSVAEYINIMSSEFDTLTAVYRAAVKTLAESDLIYDIASDFVTKKIGGFITDTMSFSTSKIASKAASLAAAVKITTYLGDKVTGVEETAKKVYQIEHMLKMIDEMVVAYSSDLIIYKANRTDENAKKVLDDLLLLKKMRLFASKLTYDSAVNQLETPLGWLMCGGEDIAALWDDIYQQQVDILLSATLDPVGALPFEVKKGEKLYVYTSKNYAYYQKNGKLHTIGEISQRLMGGLVLNGGEVYFMDGTSLDKSFYLSSITSKGDSTVKVTGNTSVALYALSQESGSLIFDLTGNIEIHKDMNFQNTNINITGSGEFICFGDLYARSARVDGNIAFNSDKKQLVNVSNFTVKGLSFANTSVEGVNISGKVNVTEWVANTSSIITGGKNILLKQYGDISGNYYKGDITLEKYAYNRNIVFDGDVYVNSAMDINAPQPLIKGSLIGEGPVTVNSSGDSSLKIIGDLGLYGSTINIGSTFEIEGDIELMGSTINVDEIVLAGKSTQKIKTDGTVNLKSLVNRNSSQKGVIVEGVWKITESICAPTGKFVSGENLILTDKVQIDGDVLNSSVTAQNWLCSDKFRMNGTLFVKGDTTFDENCEITFTQDINHSAGKLTVKENAKLYVGSDYTTTGGSIVLDGSMDISADIIMKNTDISGVGVISTGGDFFANGISGMFHTLKMESLLPQTFFADTNVSLYNLILSNPSFGGVTIESQITVYNEFVNEAFRIINGENIICRSIVDDSTDVKVVNGNLTVDIYECDTNLHVIGNLNINGSLIIPENITVIVEGDLNAETGSILIGDGGKLEVLRSLDSSASIMLGKESQLIVAEGMTNRNGITADTDSAVHIGGDWISNGSTHKLDGTVYVKCDTALCQSSVNGNGKIVLSGDLWGGSVTGISLVLESKVPQFLESDGNYTFTDITVDNTSASGMIPVENVYYTGNFDAGNSNITRPEKVINKQEG